jgi:hypothetical protein
VLADLVRTDRHNHRPVAGDTPAVEAVKVLAQAIRASSGPASGTSMRYAAPCERSTRARWPRVEAAYNEVVGALAAMLRGCNAQVAALEQVLTSQFSAHRDAAIVRSQPGLGVVLGARVLGEFGDDPHRYATAKAARPSPAPPQSPDPLGCARSWSPGGRAISGWRMPAICGRSRR